jgi:hypothetical protein
LLCPQLDSACQQLAQVLTGANAEVALSIRQRVEQLVNDPQHQQFVSVTPQQIAQLESEQQETVVEAGALSKEDFAELVSTYFYVADLLFCCRLRLRLRRGCERNHQLMRLCDYRQPSSMRSMCDSPTESQFWCSKRVPRPTTQCATSSSVAARLKCCLFVWRSM